MKKFFVLLIITLSIIILNPSLVWGKEYNLSNNSQPNDEKVRTSPTPLASSSAMPSSSISPSPSGQPESTPTPQPSVMPSPSADPTSSSGRSRGDGEGTVIVPPIVPSQIGEDDSSKGNSHSNSDSDKSTGSFNSPSPRPSSEGVVGSTKNSSPVPAPTPEGNNILGISTHPRLSVIHVPKLLQAGTNFVGQFYKNDQLSSTQTLFLLVISAILFILGVILRFPQVVELFTRLSFSPSLESQINALE